MAQVGFTWVTMREFTSYCYESRNVLARLLVFDVVRRFSLTSSFTLDSEK